MVSMLAILQWHDCFTVAQEILPPLVFSGVEAFLSSGIGLHLLRSGVLFQIEHLKHAIINIVILRKH